MLIAIIFLVVFNYGLFIEKKTEKNIIENYSHIIGTKLEIDSLTNNININKSVNINYKTIFFLVSPNCESCYVKLNKMYSLINSDARFSKVNVVVVIVGEGDNSNIVDLVNKYQFNYIIDENNTVLKENRYLSLNQIYIIDNQKIIQFVGDPFANRTIRRLFSNYINNKL